MLFADATDWWFPLTLGGSSGMDAAGSSTLGWVTFAVNLIVSVQIFRFAVVWFRAARNSLTAHGERGKRTMAWVCVVGGLAGFALPAVMVFCPVWALLLLARLTLAGLLESILRQLKSIRVVFARADAAVQIRHDLANLKMRAPLLSPTQIADELGASLARLDRAMAAETAVSTAAGGSPDARG